MEELLGLAANYMTLRSIRSSGLPRSNALTHIFARLAALLRWKTLSIRPLVCSTGRSMTPCGNVAKQSPTFVLNPARLAMTSRASRGHRPHNGFYETCRIQSDALLTGSFLLNAGSWMLPSPSSNSRRHALRCSRPNAVSRMGSRTRPCRKLQLVMPRAQRAVRIARLLEHNKMVAPTLADTLDKLVAAVFLLTDGGLIVHANTSATLLMSEQDVVSTVHGRLTPSDRWAGASLTIAIERAAEGRAALGDETQTITAVGRTGGKFILSVCPWQTGAEAAWARRTSQRSRSASRRRRSTRHAMCPDSPVSTVSRCARCPSSED